MKKILAAVMLSVMVLSLCACGSKVHVDYGNAEAFETALNNGEDLTGKVVSFTADQLEPKSMFGYDIWAGEHLNFISDKNPGVKEGETVVVRATEITSFLGSWLIKYEKVNKSETDEKTKH